MRDVFAEERFQGSQAIPLRLEATGEDGRASEVAREGGLIVYHCVDLLVDGPDRLAHSSPL